MDSKALLSLNHLSVWYTAEHPVLSDFSLDLGAAEDQSFRYFTFREYLTYVAASYGVPLPDVSGLIRDFTLRTMPMFFYRSRIFFHCLP